MQENACSLTEEQRKRLMQALAGGSRELSDLFAENRDNLEETLKDNQKGRWLTVLCVAAVLLLPFAGLCCFPQVLNSEDHVDGWVWIGICYLLALAARAMVTEHGTHKIPLLFIAASSVLMTGCLILAGCTGLPLSIVMFAALLLILIAGVVVFGVISEQKELDSSDPYCCIRDRKYVCSEITIRSKGLEEGRFPVVTDAHGVAYSCPFPADFESAERGNVMIGIETYGGDRFAVCAESAGMPSDTAPDASAEMPPDQNLPAAF